MLYTCCKSCHENIKIKSYAITRPDLSMERGDEFNQMCSHCGATRKYHVNDVWAKQNKFVLLLVVIFSLILTVVLLFAFGIIGTLTVIIPAIFAKQQLSSVAAFNSYFVNRQT